MGPESLALQVRLDTDMFNRVEAMRRLTDIQRIRLLLDPAAGVEESWLSLYREMLLDQGLSPALKAHFLRVDEQPLNREYCTWFPELVAAREKLMLAANGAFRDNLKAAFHSLDTYSPRSAPDEGIEDRILKHVLLELITIDDSPDSHSVILEHFRSAMTSSDTVSALVTLNRSSSAQRLSILEEIYQAWHPHLSGYANYLRVIGRGTRPDVFDMVAAEKNRPTFDMRNPTWSRALLLTFATNNKVIWTDRGIEWLTEAIVDLAQINPYTTGRLLNAFQHVKRLREPLKSLAIRALETIVKEIPKEACATIFNQANSYLVG